MLKSLFPSPQANRHTIVLMQTSPNRATRTFMDYQSINQAVEGICGLYERKLKEINPARHDMSYDISDLYNYIDGLTDMSALVYAYFMLFFFIVKEWHKNCLCAVYTSIISYTPLSMTIIFRHTFHMIASGSNRRLFNILGNWLVEQNIEAKLKWQSYSV
ncbi:hypothetical protein V2J09_019186 [Rumex salicifolius]